MKTEPETDSIDDLARDGRSAWEGVRNHRARNFMRDDMRVGDLVLFYHSATKPPGVAGLGRVVREAYPDPTAWNRSSQYYDPRSTPDDPVWWMVAVEFVEKFANGVTLDELKANPALRGMLVTQRGQRLSVQPVQPEHFRVILRMARAKARP
jgi:predicted RNA-binding protein with PUA-like domain